MTKGGGSSSKAGGGSHGGGSKGGGSHGGGSKGGGSHGGGGGKAHQGGGAPKQTQAQVTSAVMRNPTHPTYWGSRGYVPPNTDRVEASKYLPDKLPNKS